MRAWSCAVSPAAWPARVRAARAAAAPDQLGAAAATNTITNEVKAYVDTSRVTSSGGVQLPATRNGRRVHHGFGSGGRGRGRCGRRLRRLGGGLDDDGDHRNTVAAYVNNSSSANGVSANGAVEGLSTTGHPSMRLRGGQPRGRRLGRRGRRSVRCDRRSAGTDIANTVSAYVNGSSVSATGANVELLGTESAGIYAITIGGSFAGSGGAGGGVPLAAAGAGSNNTVKNNVSAYAANGATLTTTTCGWSSSPRPTQASSSRSPAAWPAPAPAARVAAWQARLAQRPRRTPSRTWSRPTSTPRRSRRPAQ